jgi:hypothetical protein
MKKKCTRCNVEKEVTSFYAKRNCKDGLQAHCKICSYEMTKQSNEKRRLKDTERKSKPDGKFLTLSGIKQDDYCQMYSFLSKMGYNIEMDIHSQFCEKWGINVSKRPRKGPENHWSYEDCQK